MAFMDEMQAVAIELIEEFGNRAILWSNAGEDDFKKGNVTIVSMSDEKATRAGFSIGKNERAFYISPESKFKPVPGDWIQFDSRKFTLSAVKHLQPDLRTDMYFMAVGK